MNFLFPTNYTRITIANRREKKKFERKESSKTAASKSPKRRNIKSKILTEEFTSELRWYNGMTYLPRTPTIVVVLAII